MRIALNEARRLPVLAILIPVLCSQVAQAEPNNRAEAAELTVKHLYRDYAWQAIGDKKAFGNEAVGLRYQSLTELQKYFEPGLAELMTKARECANRRSRVCTPGFDYIFDSYGGVASDLQTLPANEDNRVKVEFKNPVTDESFHLDYRMVQTANGWRIADIEYPGDSASLRGMLTKTVKQSNSAPPTQAHSAVQGSDTPEATVKRLYRDYAWQAVGSWEFGRGLVFLQAQTLPELKKYFDDGLASLLRADRDCVEKTHEMCKLDHIIIFASSAPSAHDLRISLPNKKNQVLVTFRYLANEEPIRLRYDMVNTAYGWRIHDIYEYESGVE